MKKAIGLLLAVLMLISSMSVCVFAEDEPCETVAFKIGKCVTQESDNFIIEYENTVFDMSFGKYGTQPKDRKCHFKITAKENSSLQINRLEIEQLLIDNLDIITMNAENIWEKDTFTCIDGIHDTEFLLESKTAFDAIHMIKIYYEPVQNSNASVFSKGNGAIIAVIGGAVVIAAVVIIMKKKKQKT